MKYKLTCFDVDGTLLPWDENDPTAFYPGVETKLAGLDCHVALVTNQGGPACRDAGWPWSGKYPTVEQVKQRIGQIEGRVNALTGKQAAVYIAWAFMTKNGKVFYPKDLPESHRNLDLRKPNPGMILRAMEQASVRPSETLMVGDGEEDRQAAEAAGIDFAWAEDFFERSA